MKKRRPAFALIDLPMLFFILFLNGLLIAFVFSCFTAPAPWYAWFICGMIMPIELILLVGASMIMDRWQSSSKRKYNQQHDSP